MFSKLKSVDGTSVYNMRGQIDPDRLCSYLEIALKR